MRTLFDRVKEKYNQLKKLRMNVHYTDPMRKVRAEAERKQKRDDKRMKLEENKRIRKEREKLKEQVKK